MRMFPEPDEIRDDFAPQSKPARIAARPLLSAIIDSSHDAIVSKTLDGIITSWNAGAETMFGYRAEEVIGKSIRLIIPRDRQAEEDFVLGEIRRGGRVDHFETVRQRKDGSLFDISLTISPIRDEQGTIIGASKIARDITEKKRIEREREQLLAQEQKARMQLNEALKARDQFIAVAAHELRNPLNVLHLTLQLLQRACRDPGKSAQTLALAEKTQLHFDRFAVLVDRLLDVTRARSGTLDLYREYLNLSDVVGEIASRFKAEHPGASMSVEIEPEILGSWDKLRIDQVLTNLVSNAVKYGGDKPIAIAATANDGHATITISDNGIGIPAQDLPRIFDLFERVAPDSESAGLGIGLWITKRIVEAHGGTVHAESKPGIGSTFTVRLPIDAQTTG